jgi:glycosyltransferase involved in cell wall biosynthesis
MPSSVTLIVCHFEIPRELPRTIFSLSPKFQQDVTGLDYEVLVVDNGSKSKLDLSFAREWDLNIRGLSFSDPNPSPVEALNFAVSQTDSEFIGIFIDGARIASPRLIATALEALQTSRRAVVGCRGRYLGPDFQMKSVKNGYNKAVEDAELARINWQEQGYKLFEISVPDESAGESILDIPSESNALFMSRNLWNEIGGYNTRFRSPGGGYANLELWSRLTTAPEVRTVLLIGESTFHQLHGGVATNAKDDSAQERMHNEYRRICGHSYTRPQVSPVYYGSLYGKLIQEASEITKPLRAYWERDQALEKLRKIENSILWRIVARLMKARSRFKSIISN